MALVLARVRVLWRGAKSLWLAQVKEGWMEARWEMAHGEAIDGDSLIFTGILPVSFSVAY